MDDKFFLKIIKEWISFWMNQTQNSEADHKAYQRRALGVDANMKCHLADMIDDAVRDKIQKLKAENGKLKSLILLTDPSVSDVTMNELTQKQWMEFLRCFPDNKQTSEGE